MSKYSQEFKLEVVNYYLSGQGGQEATAKRFAIESSMVRKWVSIFKHSGAQALKPKVHHNQYTAAFKYQVVNAVHQQGLSLRQAAIEFGVVESSTILCWLRLYAQGGIVALQTKVRGRTKMNKSPKATNKPDEQKTHQELLDELMYLRAEVAYLKKLDALIQQAQDKEAPSSQD